MTHTVNESASIARNADSRRPYLGLFFGLQNGCGLACAEVVILDGGSRGCRNIVKIHSAFRYVPISQVPGFRHVHDLLFLAAINRHTPDAGAEVFYVVKIASIVGFHTDKTAMPSDLS